MEQKIALYKILVDKYNMVLKIKSYVYSCIPKYSSASLIPSFLSVVSVTCSQLHSKIGKYCTLHKKIFWEQERPTTFI